MNALHTCMRISLSMFISLSTRFHLSNPRVRHMTNAHSTSSELSLSPSLPTPLSLSRCRSVEPFCFCPAGRTVYARSHYRNGRYTLGDEIRMRGHKVIRNRALDRRARKGMRGSAERHACSRARSPTSSRRNENETNKQRQQKMHSFLRCYPA